MKVLLNFKRRNSLVMMQKGANVFEVPYFNEKVAHLATSPQFYKQMMVGVFERVFCIGNVFRAENIAQRDI